MIWIYRILFLPLLLLTVPYYLKRMVKRGGYGKDFHHRFGMIGPIPPKSSRVKRIWLQAVSVGELLAVEPLLQTLAEDKEVEVVLTTTTSTGYRLARENFVATTTTRGIFPLDFWFCSRVAWRRIAPDLVVLMESEFWPEHIHQAKTRKVPVMLINTRISDRSYHRYSKVPFFSQWLLKPIDALLVATAQDCERFLAMGAAPEKTHLTGNLKFDVKIEPRLKAKEISLLKTQLGFYRYRGAEDDPLVVLGSSTWPGEEAALLTLLEKAEQVGIDCRLLLVPRHAERRDEIEPLLRTRQYPYHYRSRSKEAPQPVKIYVGDTTGELKLLTQAADLVFIGKSLPPNDGGQTPIEAAALGKPVLFGPNMSNFHQICESLLQEGAARRVADATDLYEKGIALMQTPDKRSRMAKAALRWHASNRGAVAKTVAIIHTFLREQPAKAAGSSSSFNRGKERCGGNV